MTMKRVDARFPRGCFAAALILFLLLSGLILLDSSMKFTAVKSAVVNGDMICGINVEGLQSELFLVSPETGEGSFIRKLHITGRGIASYSGPYIAQDGTILFGERVMADDGSISDRYLSWDSKWNRMEEVVKDPPAPAISLGEAPAAVKKGSAASAGPKADGTLPAESASAEEAVQTGGPVLEGYIDYFHLQNRKKLLTLEKDGRVQIRLIDGKESWTLDGVKRPVSRTVFRLVIALLASFLLYLVLRLAGEAAASALHVPWLMLRLCFFSAGLILLLIPITNQLLRRYLYANGCRNVLYHCEDAAALQGEIMDAELLKRMITEEGQLTEENLDSFWRTEKEMDAQAGAILQEKNEKDLSVLVKSEEYCVVYQENDQIILLSRSAEKKDGWMILPEGSLKNLLSRIFDDGRVRSYMTILSGERYAEVFVPVEVESGSTVLVGARMPVSGILLSIFRQRMIIIRIFVMIGLLMFICMVAVFSRCLAPLSNLTEAVSDFASGNLQARAVPKGYNEISYTARCFNEMADTLSAQSAGADSFRRLYEAFFPASLLRRFSGKSIPEALECGKGYGAASVCLFLASRGAADQESRAMMEEAIRISRKDGGHLATLVDEGMKLVYTDSSEAPLRTAVALEQLELRNGRSAAHIGIASGPVRLYVTGSSRRKSISEVDSGEAAVLSHLAEFLEIPVIMTEKIYL